MTEFGKRLQDHPVVLEVIPPKLGAKDTQVEEALALIDHVLQVAKVDAVNVPEIIGNGFQSMDPVDFGLRVKDRFGVAVIVNKVVVHEPVEVLRAWGRRVLEAGMASAILVGGERGGIYYPGPRVTEANRLLRQLADEIGRQDFRIGNVTLPARAHEAARMLDKVRSGCDYFTSQIVYDFPSVNSHLQAYDDVCALADLEPSPVLYAFSPAETKQDILFLRYLGVNIPPETEAALLAPGVPGAASLGIIESIWRDLLAAARARAVRVPIGLVVETVARRNAPSLGGLIQRLRAALDSFPVASPLLGVTAAPK